MNAQGIPNERAECAMPKEHDHHIALRLFVASVWLILLAFYMLLYAIDPSMFIFSDALILLVTGGGFLLFGVTYRLLKQSEKPAPRADTRTPVERILGTQRK